MAHDNMSRAESIHRMITRSGEKIGVFAIKRFDGVIFRTCRINNDLWNATIESKRKKKDPINGDMTLVGVYDETCDANDILEDLDFVSGPAKRLTINYKR